MVKFSQVSHFKKVPKGKFLIIIPAQRTFCGVSLLSGYTHWSHQRRKKFSPKRSKSTDTRVSSTCILRGLVWIEVRRQHVQEVSVILCTFFHIRVDVGQEKEIQDWKKFQKYPSMFLQCFAVFLLLQNKVDVNWQGEDCSVPAECLLG